MKKNGKPNGARGVRPQTTENLRNRKTYLNRLAVGLPGPDARRRVFGSESWQQGDDEPARGLLLFHCRDLGLGYQAASSRLPGDGSEIANRLRVGAAYVAKCAQRAAYRETAQVGDLGRREFGPMQHDHLGEAAVATKRGRDRQVNFGWVEIAEFEQAERTLVRDHCLGLLVTATRPEEPDHHLSIFGRWQV